MTEPNPLVWLWLLGACALIATQSTNPLLLITVVGALVGTGVLVGGPRHAVLVLSVRAAALLLLVWFGFTLIAPDRTGGDVLWHRPQVSLGSGTSMGGPLTVAGVSTGLVDGLRAAVVALLLGVASQVVGGRTWRAVAHSTLGGLAPLVAPWCHVGDAVAGSALEAGRHRVWGLPVASRPGEVLRRAANLAREHTHSPGPPTDPRPTLVTVAVAGLVLWPAADPVGARSVSPIELVLTTTFVVVALGTALPGRDPAVMRGGPADLPPLLVAVALTALWAARDVVLTDGSTIPSPGDWSAPPAALVLAVLLIPGSALLASALRGPRPRQEVARAEVA